MNALATPRNSAKRGLSLAAAMLGILVLAFGVAPGTVLASSATDVYTEQPPPPTPSKNDKGDKDKNGGKGKKNGGKNKSGGNKSGNGSGGTGGSGSTGYSYDPGTGSTGDTPVSQGTGQDGSVNGTQGTGTDGQAQTDPAESTGTGDTSDETIAVTPAGGDSGGGGSALPMIIAILVGIPLIGGIAYYAWCRYRSRDDHLDSAFNDPPVGP